MADLAHGASVVNAFASTPASQVASQKASARELGSKRGSPTPMLRSPSMRTPSPTRSPRKGPLGNFNLDESEDAPPVSAQIIAALTSSAAKILDLFRSWDTNDDGVITRQEFHEALRALGLDASVPKEHIDDIFSTWDATGGGTIDYAELSRILRAAATMTKTMEKIRKGVTGGAGGVKVSQLFAQWDENGDGTVDREEFRKAIKNAGLQIANSHLDACFDAFDKDGNGRISYREFKKAISRDPKAELEAKRKRDEEARRQRELANRVELVEINDLKVKVRQNLRRIENVDANGRRLPHDPSAEAEAPSAEPAGADAAAPGTSTAMVPSKSATLAPVLAPPQTILTAKSKELDKERHHLRLRLMGTGMELTERVEPQITFKLQHSMSDADFGGGSKSQTTLVRKPYLNAAPRMKNGMPRPIDILAAHRPRSFRPSRRNCELSPPKERPKVSQKRLDMLQHLSMQKAIARMELAQMNISRSVPNLSGRDEMWGRAVGYSGSPRAFGDGFGSLSGFY